MKERRALAGIPVAVPVSFAVITSLLLIYAWPIHFRPSNTILAILGLIVIGWAVVFAALARGSLKYIYGALSALNLLLGTGAILAALAPQSLASLQTILLVSAGVAFIIVQVAIARAIFFARSKDE
jgi:hypothetical protein